MEEYEQSEDLNSVEGLEEGSVLVEEVQQSPSRAAEGATEVDSASVSDPSANIPDPV